MILRIFFVLTFLLPSILFAQVEIKPKEETYTRKAAGAPTHKKTFKVRYPMVSGVDSAEKARKIKNALDYWSNFDISLEESLNDYYWLDSLDYKVNYLDGGLLDISLIMEGSAAYPNGYEKTLVIDLMQGRRLYINDVFVDIGNLVLKIDKAHKADVKRARETARKDGLDDADSFDTLIETQKLTLKKLEDYSISETGVTFIYDYGFPHAFEALEPEGRFFFSWRELAPFVKKGAALEKFRANR